MSEEYGREIERMTGMYIDGAKIPASQLVCPECGTLNTSTTVVPPKVAGLEYEATCPQKHTWRFFLVDSH